MAKNKLVKVRGSVAGKRANGQGAVRLLRLRFGMTQREFSRVVDLSERRLAAVERGEAEVTQTVQRRVTEARRLHRELSHVIDADEIERWMKWPNPAFGEQTPLQVLEKGESDRLWRMIYELQSGTPG